MAFRYPDDSQKTSLYDPILMYGLAGIARTCGMEPAGRWPKRRNEFLIYGYQSDNYISDVMQGISY